MFKKVVLGASAALIMSNAQAEVNLQAWIKENHAKSKNTDVANVVKQVEHFARLKHLDKKLILAVIATESGFDHKASNSGAKGLMQVQKAVHKKLIAGRNVTDVKTNIDVGTKILLDCKVKSEGDLTKTLACYSGKRGKSARNYVSIVKKKMDKLTLATGGNNG